MTAAAHGNTLAAWLDAWGFMLGNVAVVLIFAGIAWFASSVLPREPWRSACRQLRHRPMAWISLILLCLYALVGILDSISWRDALKDEQGKPRRDATGRIQLEPKPLSILDRICSPLRLQNEKTYSAPLADRQFSKDLVKDDTGRSTWVSAPLKYPGTHLLGTNKVGQDVLFQALKGVRTALVIGGLGTLIIIPFALFFGVMAGYYGGWIDDVVQYLYSVLASIPGILLIVSFVLIFGRGLAQLCIILGIASWTGLCRLVRAECLKLRELEYVQAAEALGVSRPRILLKHVVPNLMHLVTISAVLQFSGLVLAEAVLAYVGVGVPVDVGSWGNMINNARLELTREPVVWWNLMAAFLLMLGLVLPANLLGDNLRDALDPRMRRR